MTRVRIRKYKSINFTRDYSIELRVIDLEKLISLYLSFSVLVNYFSFPTAKLAFLQ